MLFISDKGELVGKVRKKWHSSPQRDTIFGQMPFDVRNFDLGSGKTDLFKFCSVKRRGWKIFLVAFTLLLDG